MNNLKEKLASLLSKLSPDKKDAILKDKDLIEFIDKYVKFQNAVKDGELGLTACLWIQFIEHARDICYMIYATKTNNFELYHAMNSKSKDIFF